MEWVTNPIIAIDLKILITIIDNYSIYDKQAFKSHIWSLRDRQIEWVQVFDSTTFSLSWPLNTAIIKPHDKYSNSLKL